MPIDYKKYPANWAEIREMVRARSGDRCEGSPFYPECGAENGKAHPVTGSRVVLTVAHLDHDTTNNSMENLRHWCQRCHLRYDRDLHLLHRREKREGKNRV